MFENKVGTSSEGHCGPYANWELPLPSYYNTCGFILFAPDGPDTRTISPSDSYYHLGVNLSLSCHTASNPPAQYSWLINGRPQPSTQELIISNITANDSRFYTCLVYNSGTCLHKTTVKTITVSGECIPGASALSTVVKVCLPFRKEPGKVISPLLDTIKAQISPSTLLLHVCRCFFPLLSDFSLQTLSSAWNVGRGVLSSRKPVA